MNGLGMHIWHLTKCQTPSFDYTVAQAQLSKIKQI